MYMYNKKKKKVNLSLIQFKKEGLTKILQAVRCHIKNFYDRINTTNQFIKPCFGQKKAVYFLRNMEPLRECG